MIVLKKCRGKTRHSIKFAQVERRRADPRDYIHDKRSRDVGRRTTIFFYTPAPKCTLSFIYKSNLEAIYKSDIVKLGDVMGIFSHSGAHFALLSSRVANHSASLAFLHI